MFYIIMYMHMCIGISESDLCKIKCKRAFIVYEGECS